MLGHVVYADYSDNYFIFRDINYHIKELNQLECVDNEVVELNSVYLNSNEYVHEPILGMAVMGIFSGSIYYQRGTIVNIRSQVNFKIESIHGVYCDTTCVEVKHIKV